MTESFRRYLPFLGFGSKAYNIFGHPYALSRIALRQAIKRSVSLFQAGPTLDVGCGTMPWKDLFVENIPYHGLEINQTRNLENPNVDYLYDGTTFPVGSNVYSVVVCFQVLEHSFEPERMLNECNRVLRQGGSLLLTVPFIWPEHEQPWDSQRFTSYGLVDRLAKSGFQVKSMIKTNIGVSALFQLLIDLIESKGMYIYGMLPRGPIALTFLIAWKVLLALPYSLINTFGYLFSSSSPQELKNSDNKSLYLDLVIVAEKK